MEPDAALAMHLAGVFEMLTVGRTYRSTSRDQAAEQTLKFMAQLGFVKCATTLSDHKQRVADTLGAWWGELRGGKWEALAALLKSVLHIDKKPDSLRVEYTRWRRKMNFPALSQKLHRP